MKTRTYEGIRHGDWVRCVLCGAQMLLPCGADKCPECSSEGTLTWVDENRQEMDAKHLELRNLLKDGEYIPSLRQLNLMAHYKDSINDALKYIGAEPLASEWFWSSTESSQYNAWYVYFFIGDTGSYSKYGSGRVRAVIDF